MKKMKKTNKTRKSILLASIAVVCFGAIAAGSTYALFTSKAETNVTVTTGKVSLTKSISDIKLYSLDNGEQKQLDSSSTEFTSGASFKYDTTTGAVTLDKFLPGDKVTFKITITNESNVNIKYRTVYKVLEDNGLFNGLKVTINSAEFDGYTTESNYEAWNLNDTSTKTLDVSIELPEEVDNQYSSKSTSFSINAEAIQGNAKTEEVDTTTFKISNHIDLVAFAKRLNSGVFSYTNVELINNIDMKGISYPSPSFKAGHEVTFDGKNHTISNFTPSQTDDGSNIYAGLIGHIGSNSLTIQNVNFETAKAACYVTDYAALANDTDKRSPGAGVVVGFADAGCSLLTLSNISVKDIAVSNTKYAGGLIGYTSCTTNINNCKFEVSDDNTNTIEGYTAGGIIGQVGGKATTISGITLSGKVSVSGYKREGGLVGAVSGASLTITIDNLDSQKSNLSISGSVIEGGNSGKLVGLKGNTTVNGNTLN